MKPITLATGLILGHQIVGENLLSDRTTILPDDLEYPEHWQ
jgi:hypothetical protein